MLALDKQISVQDKKSDLDPVTIMMAKGKKGQPVAARMLVGACCTGNSLTSSRTVRDLGLCSMYQRYEFPRGSIYVHLSSVEGTFKSQGCLKVSSATLLVLF